MCVACVEVAPLICFPSYSILPPISGPAEETAARSHSGVRHSAAAASGRVRAGRGEWRKRVRWESPPHPHWGQRVKSASSLARVIALASLCDFVVCLTSSLPCVITLISLFHFHVFSLLPHTLTSTTGPSLCCRAPTRIPPPPLSSHPHSSTSSSSSSRWSFLST